MGKAYEYLKTRSIYRIFITLDGLLSGNTKILLSLVTLKGCNKINEFQKDFQLSDNSYPEITNTF